MNASISKYVFSGGFVTKILLIFEKGHESWGLLFYQIVGTDHFFEGLGLLDEH